MLHTIDRGHGRTVMLLHGQPGTGASWSRVTDLLSSDYRVLAPDRPGYGRTQGDGMGMAENADALANLLRIRRGVPATVVGHSWSGGVAVLMAARHPDVVRSLVLVGAVGTPDSVNGLDRLLAVPAVGSALTVAGLVGIGMVLPALWGVAGRFPRQARDHITASLPNESIAGGWSEIVGRQRRTFVIEQRALLSELPGVAAVLGTLAVPVTVVTGEWDIVVPPAAASSMVRAIPGAELVRIPRVGHFVQRDAPRTVTAVIRATDRRGTDGASGGPPRR